MKWVNKLIVSEVHVYVIFWKTCCGNTVDFYVKCKLKECWQKRIENFHKNQCARLARITKLSSSARTATGTLCKPSSVPFQSGRFLAFAFHFHMPLRARTGRVHTLNRHCVAYRRYRDETIESAISCDRRRSKRPARSAGEMATINAQHQITLFNFSTFALYNRFSCK